VIDYAVTLAVEHTLGVSLVLRPYQTRSPIRSDGRSATTRPRLFQDRDWVSWVLAG